MQPPNDDAGKSSMFHFRCNEVTNARFIDSSVIADNHYVASLRGSECLEKHVNTSKVLNRTRSSAKPRLRRCRP